MVHTVGLLLTYGKTNISYCEPTKTSFSQHLANMGPTILFYLKIHLLITFSLFLLFLYNFSNKASVSNLCIFQKIWEILCIKEINFTNVSYCYNLCHTLLFYFKLQCHVFNYNVYVIMSHLFWKPYYTTIHRTPT